MGLKIVKQEQTSGECVRRRNLTRINSLTIPEYHILDEKDHLLAITFVHPDELEWQIREDRRKSDSSKPKEIVSVSKPKRKKASSRSNRSSSNRRAKKKN